MNCVFGIVWLYKLQPFLETSGDVLKLIKSVSISPGVEKINEIFFKVSSFLFLSY